jgi:hypothetical protein
VLAPLRAAADNAVDPDPSPTDVGGTLTQGGELSGTAEIDFLVNPDGIYTATMTVDGGAEPSQTVDQGSGHLYLDTATLTDGSHQVVVTVGDADATDTVWSGTIETLNAPQGGIPTISGTAAVGQTLSAAPGSWSPLANTIGYQWKRCDATASNCAPIAGAVNSTYELADADTNAQLEVEVSAGDSSGTTVATSAPTAIVSGSADSGIPGASPAAPGTSAAGVPNGSGACAAAHLTAELGSGVTQTVALGQTATLHGQLDCGSGAAAAPIAGATLELSLAPAAPGAANVDEQIQTATDGSFSYRVPAGASRKITVTYDAFSGATKPSALASVSLLVHAKVTLKITPTATTNGHTITFSGRVLGGYISRSGLPLEVEYREGSHWMIYIQVLAKPSAGRYSWHYTFERTTESITYSFRVAIPSTGVPGYPYQPAASPVRSVHVDP